jgi:phosphatidylserine decarboxylase
MRWAGSLASLWKEDLFFLATNRLPRRAFTIAMGWFSRLEIGWLARLSIALWRRLDRGLDLAEAKLDRFASLHDCFVRELKPGARPIDLDPAVLTSPCDAIVGACGRIEGGTLFQAKGFPYSLRDLVIDPARVERLCGGLFVTLRIKPSDYHRFHAPCDGALRRVTYVAGDTWNVHPIALRRVERLFCRNERAVLDLVLAQPERALTLVPVAAILVAGIKLHALPEVLDLSHRGANELACDATFSKGDELGWFQHGSTIVVLANGPWRLADGVAEGARLRVGQPLLRETPA